jgi:hypothetical protein
MGTNRTEQKVGEGKIIEGLQKHASTMTNLIVQNQTVTATQAIATLQARIDAITAAQTAKIAWIDAAQQQDKELASTDTFVEALVTVIRGMFAGSASTLADFGISPKKATKLTAEQQALASQKRRATREARHTMGSKQKAGIKGTVPTVTEPTTTASVATPAAPVTTPTSTVTVPTVTGSASAAGGATGVAHA